MDTKPVSTFAELCDLLRSENVVCEGDVENHVVTFAVKNGPLETEMIIRWEKELLLAQFAVAFPYKIPPQHMQGTEHAVAVVNHRLVMPAFGIDHDNRVLYYRVVVPRADDGGISYDHLFRLVSTTIDTMIDFYELLVQVVLHGNRIEPLLEELGPRLKSAVVSSDATTNRKDGSLPS